MPVRRGLDESAVGTTVSREGVYKGGGEGTERGRWNHC